MNYTQIHTRTNMLSQPQAKCSTELLSAYQSRVHGKLFCKTTVGDICCNYKHLAWVEKQTKSVLFLVFDFNHHLLLLIAFLFIVNTRSGNCLVCCLIQPLRQFFNAAQKHKIISGEQLLPF